MAGSAPNSPGVAPAVAVPAPDQREKFLQRSGRQVDPYGKIPPHERRRRAERAYVLSLATRAVIARKAQR